VAQGVGPEFKPQCYKKKERKKEIEHLPCKHEALSSNSSIAKKTSKQTTTKKP
jgi:hypothetical protein